VGGNRIEDIKKTIDDIFISLENGEFEKLHSLVSNLGSVDFSKYSDREKMLILSSLDSVLKMASEKRMNIANRMEETKKLKKFKF